MSELHPQARLDAILRHMRRHGGDAPARLAVVSGPLGSGKNALVADFALRVAMPTITLDGATGDPAIDQVSAVASVRRQAGAAAGLVPQARRPLGQPMAAATPQSWLDACDIIAPLIPAEQSMLVIEHVERFGDAPALVAAISAAFAGAWARKPVLVVLLTRDGGLAERLRGAVPRGDAGFDSGSFEVAHIAVGGMPAVRIAQRFGCDAASALDVVAVTGGLPTLVDALADPCDLERSVIGALADPYHPLHVVGERALAEFVPTGRPAPGAHHAWSMLQAIAAGENSHARIAAASPGVPRGSFSRILVDLVSAGWVVAETPSTGRASKETRYRVADPFLAWWLWAIAPDRAALLRGDCGAATERVRRGLAGFCSRAVVPVLRSVCAQSPELLGLGASARLAVGGFWTRGDDPVVPIVAREAGSGAVVALADVRWSAGRGAMDAEGARALIPGASASTPVVRLDRSLTLHAAQTRPLARVGT